VLVLCLQTIEVGGAFAINHGVSSHHPAILHGRTSLVVVHAKKSKTAAGGLGTSKGFGAVSEKAVAAPKPIATATTKEVFRISEVPLIKGVSCDIGSQGADVPLNTLFMGAFMIEDTSVCDDLNTLYDANPQDHRRGVIGRDGKPVVDTEKKDSFEIFFQPNDPRPAWSRYITALQQCTIPCMLFCSFYLRQPSLSLYFVTLPFITLPL